MFLNAGNDPHVSHGTAVQYFKSGLVSGTVMSRNRLLDRRKLYDGGPLLESGFIHLSRDCPCHDSSATGLDRRHRELAICGKFNGIFYLPITTNPICDSHVPSSKGNPNTPNIRVMMRFCSAAAAQSTMAADRQRAAHRP